MPIMGVEPRETSCLAVARRGIHFFPFSKPCRFLARAGRGATLMARHHANEQTCRQEETAVYRRLVLLCSVVIGAMAAASATRAADPERCQGLSRRFEITKPQITAMEVSLTLFSAVDANCIDLATKLLDQGASVDARHIIWSAVRSPVRPETSGSAARHLDVNNWISARMNPIRERPLIAFSTSA